jgi:hypothetical protein
MGAEDLLEDGEDLGDAGIVDPVKERRAAAAEFDHAVVAQPRQMLRQGPRR